jgi:antitoxin component of RelBE/YafQ-DinJ toxin-antitoxin module
MSTTRLQVTINTSTLNKVKKKIAQAGLEGVNVQNLVQIFLNKVAKQGIDLDLQIPDNLPSYDVSEETEKEIGEALEDYKQGRYTTLVNNVEIEKHFKDLLKKQ